VGQGQDRIPIPILIIIIIIIMIMIMGFLGLRRPRRTKKGKARKESKAAT